MSSSSLLANGIWNNAYMVQAALCGANFVPRPPREQAFNALGNYYRCRDGRWLILTILNEERQWPLFAQALGREELTADPRFVTKPDRLKNAAVLVQTLEGIFAEQDRPFWAKALGERGIVFDAVATPADVAADPQITANGMFVPFDNSALMTIDSPIRVVGSDKVQPRLPPELGQHSDEILREAGFDTDAIGAMRATGALG